METFLQNEEERGDWQSGFCIELRNCLQSVRMQPHPAATEDKVRQAYEWFMAHHQTPRERTRAPRPPNPPSFHNFCEDEIKEHCLPGSAFFTAQQDINLADQEDEGESAALPSSSLQGAPVGRLLPGQVVQLPPARERLKYFETRQIVSPLTARKLKAATCESPELTDRPITPSTATGGYSARTSVPSSRCTTAMGTHSRPSSAISSYRRPLTAQTARSATPDSGAGVSRTLDASRPRTPGSGAGTRPPQVPMLGLHLLSSEFNRGIGEPEWKAEELAMAEANMEERWLERRHREVTNIAVEEERHAAVAAWAERRARVEEEIARNAEAIRFQSELQQRGYSMPSDAAEDIDATAPAVPAVPASPQQPQQIPGDTSCNASSAGESLADQVEEVSVQQSPVPKDAPRYDVTQVSEGDQPRVQFQIAESRSKHISTRIGYLRKIHAHLISAPEDPEIEIGDSGAPPMSVFDTEDGDQHLSLSAYTCGGVQGSDGILVNGVPRSGAPRSKDDIDTLAGLCDWWRHTHGIKSPTPADSGITLDEMYFQQCQEAEAVKRVLASGGIPVNATSVHNALVMPVHKYKANVGLFNTEPNLLKNPFAQEMRRKKKKKRASITKVSRGNAKGKSTAKASPKRR